MSVTVLMSPVAVVDVKAMEMPVATPRAGVVRVGLVNVLLVRVSVVARPTKVSVLVGRVRVPVLEIVAITGLVKVLFVKVSVVALPT